MTDLDGDGRTPLHHAAFDRDVARIRALAREFDVDAVDKKGFTALHFAAQQGGREAAQALLDAGCAVDPTNAWGNTPLWTAVFSSQGGGDVIRLLRERGANPWHLNNSGKSPVDLARLIANYDIAQFFADLPASAPGGIQLAPNPAET